MPSCLGMYVQDNLIKYAKVSKDHDKIKVDSFGVKFYENINEAIKQVVEETYSYKTPISINLEQEIYNYFDMFALLNKTDLQKAIKTEFDAFCQDKGYNPNAFEKRSAVVPNIDDKQKLKVIHVSENKIEFSKMLQLFSGYKLAAVSPISMTISNLKEFEPKQNYLIVNIEDQTTVTTIIDQQIYNIETIPQGSKEFLEKLNMIENSYSKAYETCKNTTIYTSEGRELQDIENSHLEEIMPTLYSIVSQIQKIINSNTAKIEKVYITGTAALINNIDLYFQEYLEDTKCEILKPSFITNTKDINIKDYIEVNSAISLALLGLGQGLTSMNFKGSTFADKLPDWLKIDVGGSNKTKGKDKNKQKGLFTFDLGQKLDTVERNLLRSAGGLFILLAVYSGFSCVLNNQLNSKQEEAAARTSQINSQIALAKADDSKIKNKTSEYTTMIKNLQYINDRINNALKTKNAIPNLLNQIMFIIPENVQITSIQNTTDKHIEINAQSNKYEQLGYLKAKIKADNILTNVISTAGQKENNVVTVKIEGDLP